MKFFDNIAKAFQPKDASQAKPFEPEQTVEKDTGFPAQLSQVVKHYHDNYFAHVDEKSSPARVDGLLKDFYATMQELAQRAKEKDLNSRLKKDDWLVTEQSIKARIEEAYQSELGFLQEKLQHLFESDDERKKAQALAILQNWREKKFSSVLIG